MINSQITCLGWCCLFAVMLAPNPVGAQEAVLLQHRWEIDPDRGHKWIFAVVQPPRTIDALRLGSSSRQHRVSEAQKVLFANRGGGVVNRVQALEAAVQSLRSGESNRQVKLSMTSAAVSLAENSSEGESIWDAVGADAAARYAIEPKLIEWKSTIAIELWRERIADGTLADGYLLTAIDGIAVVGAPTDRPALEGLLRADRSSLATRIAASKALGALTADGLEGFAQEILRSDVDQRELIAANLLAGHSSAGAQRILVDVLDQESDVAQVVAYRAIARNMPEKARELAGTMIRHPENLIRRETVSFLNGLDDEESLNLQAVALSDRNVHVRRTVRENLQKKATVSSLKQVVDDIITHQLTGSSYRGAEQAILLAVALGQKRRATTFLSLLDHPQPEVSIRAGWALQAFELEPDTLHDIFRHCQATTKRIVGHEHVPFTEIARIAFLFEALGRNSYKPASDMLLAYVPKKKPFTLQPLTRASAIYALGHIWAGRSNKPLTDELVSRVEDEDPYDPEAEIVKYTAINALNLINARPIVKAAE